MLHNHYQHIGGEDHSFRAEKEILQSNQHIVKSFTLHNNDISQINMHHLAKKTIWNSASYREIDDLIKERRYDVAHFQNTFPLISPSGYYAASKHGVPVIQSLRNYRLACINGLFFRNGAVCENCLDSNTLFSGIKHRCYRNHLGASSVATMMLLFHRILRTYQNKVDLFIALSEFSKRKFIEIGIPEGKIFVKPNFVQSDIGQGDGKGRFGLFVGRLSHEKGLGTLLSALEKLDNSIPFKIVGKGPLESLVQKKMKVNSQLAWLGHLPIREVYDLMGRATVLVFSSEWYETFGRVAIEAFAKGTPVLVSKIGAIQELIDDGRTGKHFIAGNSNDLSEKLEWFFNNPDKVGEMRREARAEFEAKYTAERNYEMLMAIYERAIELNKSR